MAPDRDSFSVPPWLRNGASVERSMSETIRQLEQRIGVLERERADLRRILRGMGEGVLAVDRAGVVVHANPAAIAMLGIDADSCLGSHMYVAVPHPEACDALDSVLRDERIRPRHTRELTIEVEEGIAQQLVVAVRPLRPAHATEDTEPEGAIAVVTDVTELRRLERTRQDFFTNVSHELKTPITVIRGALETIADDRDMPDDVRDRFLDNANRHAVRLSALVTDLLALARLEDDAAALQRAEIDVCALVRDVVDHARAGAERLGVNIVVEPGDHPGGQLLVMGDDESLMQALSNLIDNAVAHSNAGSSVIIAIVVDGGMVNLTVTDHGAGIPPEALERVFERFYRVDSARSRARGGTGIGLSIVKHVAQVHGGSISVTSTLEAGSTFVLRIPTADAS